ncbi:disease resistance protein RPM1-like [Musa acuminata AAA Group]|uniref:disease resistance protein RPM1-like n=1 Tax=Musa acuminata AAA Group TaxID=214697 RepID=UPI0031D0FD2F
MAEAMLASLLPNLASAIAAPISNAGHLLSTVGDGVDWLRDELRSMRSFLVNTETSATEDHMSWADEIRAIVYDSEDIIDAFDAISSHPFACFLCHLRSRHRVGWKIREIKNRLDDHFRRRSGYLNPAGDRSTSLDLHNRWIHGLLASSPWTHQGERIVGFEEDFDAVVGRLMNGSPELSVLSLVGMGGVGKTTLVKKVFNHSDVRRHFDHLAWVYVSRSFRLGNLVNEVAKGLMQIPSTEIDALSERQLQELLLRTLKEKRFLLVLDDVWDRGVWETIRLVLPINGHGNRVIITTRNSEVADSVVGARSCTHVLRPLSHEESWELFCDKVFAVSEPCPDELIEVAERIVRKCHGLPLAIAIVGGMMLRKGRSPLEWNHVLNNIYSDLIGNEVEVQGPLFLSYKDLPYPLKSCFLLCSIFPQDWNIPRKKLIRLWIAEGLIKDVERERVEDVAEKYLMELINRNMFQISIISSSGRVKACRIHHLLHQLSISISRAQNFSAVYEDQQAVIPSRASRISLQKSSYDALQNKGWEKLRSLFMFGIFDSLHISERMLKNLRLLRVLDLENASLVELPGEVGNLFHLRYFSVRGTRLEKLPVSLKNLCNLQILDIRRTQLRKLSFEIKRLKNLRHLEMRQDEKSIKVPLGLSRMQYLQVVTGVQADCTFVHEVGKLTELRKLAVGDLRAEDAAVLCSSINNMAGLLSLSIFSIDVSTAIDLEKLNPSSLQKLHIAGRLERLPHWFSGISNLTKLRLGLSGLFADPFEVLQQLPNLVFLQLYEAYQGKVLRCANRGFIKLKILILTDLKELEEWEVEDGAMRCIQEMWIMSCSKLKTVPLGLEFLVTLQQLRLVSMPEHFVKRLNPAEGEDFIKVKHIPSIQVN